MKAIILLLLSFPSSTCRYEQNGVHESKAFLPFLFLIKGNCSLHKIDGLLRFLTDACSLDYLMRILTKLRVQESTLQRKLSAQIESLLKFISAYRILVLTSLQRNVPSSTLIYFLKVAPLYSQQFSNKPHRERERSIQKFKPNTCKNGIKEVKIEIDR